ncbi:hypothetical protein D3C73_1507520 [compost metagenome]
MENPIMPVYIYNRLIAPELENLLSIYGSRNSPSVISTIATRQIIVTHSLPTRLLQKFTYFGTSSLYPTPQTVVIIAADSGDTLFSFSRNRLT